MDLNTDDTQSATRSGMWQARVEKASARRTKRARPPPALIWRDTGCRCVSKMARDDMKGFVVLPRRWVVERTFSWFGRNRRLNKDYENLADTLAAFITMACIQLALGRLAQM